MALPRTALRSAASTAAGILLGLAALEASTRLITYEHEADGNYWGRGAFVSDRVLGYRHAPSTSAVVGRYGAFGPTVVTTNQLGYRDTRLPEDAPPGAPRLMVVGASHMFGLGVDAEEALFHRQLEELLRARPEVPDDLTAFNVSQTGFRLRQLELLTQREVDRFDPDMVLLALHPAAPARPDQTAVDIVNGYRLSGARFGRGSWLDELRTRSAVYMFAARSPLLHPSTYMNGQLLVPDDLHDRQQRTSADSVSQGAIARAVGRIGAHLAERGVAFVPMALYGVHNATRREQVRYATVHVFQTMEWRLEGDQHWRAFGHREAARQAAEQMPTARLTRRGRR